jgi:hypothetical protein
VGAGVGDTLIVYGDGTATATATYHFDLIDQSSPETHGKSVHAH